MFATRVNLRRLCSVLVLAVIFEALYVGAVGTRAVHSGILATTRYVAAGGNDISDCSSPASPCRTIQYTVSKASSGDTILVAQGTYTYSQAVDPCDFLPPTGKSVVCIVDKVITILGGYSTSNWGMADPAVNLTVIDGQDSYRGVFLIGYNTTTASLSMEGFTIQNGRVQGPNTPGDPSGFGGGMMVAGARVTLRDMFFKNNKVYGQSGTNGAGAGAGLAINWSQPGTSSLLERVTLVGNQSYGGTGSDRGGIVFGALFVNGSVTINYGTFTNNQAFAGSSSGSGRSGDGLCADALGGAIGGGGGSWTLQHIVATGNQVVGGNATDCAGGGFGAGIHVEEATSFSITDSYLSGNVAKGGDAVINGGFGAGGGILVNTTPATISRVQLISNSAIGGSSTDGGNAGAGGGGGLYLWRTRAAVNPVASVTNVIVADNYVALGSSGGTAAGGGGGGIQVQGMQANITHLTLARNRLGPGLVSGQGLLVLAAPGVGSATANVSYSIIANHTEGASGASAVLIQQNNTANFNRGLFAGNIKNTNQDGSPMLPGTFNGLATMTSASSAGFVSPGAPTYNYRLLPTSIAVDRAVGSSATNDIDKLNRPYNVVPDLGASEYWPSGQYRVYLPLIVR